MVLKQRKRFRVGEVIFDEGDLGDCAYIIERGRVEIFVTSAAERVSLTTLGVGEIFGEMSVIDGSPRSASAVAIEPCELVMVSSEAISERIDSADPIVRLLISMLLKRMRFTNRSAKRVQGKDAPLTPSLAIDLIEPHTVSHQTQEVLEKMRIESELKQALSSDEFALHFQPIIDLQRRTIAGFEALIRWSSPDRGLVRPDIFMGIAEETSLIVPIGKWVMEKACYSLAMMERAMRAKGSSEPLFMSINISGRQFHDVHFFDDLTNAVKLNGIDSKQVKLEVTERIFMEGPAAIHAIKKCRSLGFPVALDDFGTGFSSLSYLAQFQVDNLKVDQSFIRRMLRDERTFVITQAIVAMANGLHVPVVAEGIETVEDFRALCDMNCRYGQGYLFSKPMPFDDALNLLLDQDEIVTAS
ncbi:MAG: EAL domain-containing protein [Oligoflexus sp.]